MIAASRAFAIFSPLIEPDLSITIATFTGTRFSSLISKPVRPTFRYVICCLPPSRNGVPSPTLSFTCAAEAPDPSATSVARASVRTFALVFIAFPFPGQLFEHPAAAAAAARPVASATPFSRGVSPLPHH